MSAGHPISGAARSPDQWSGSVERVGRPILRTDGRTDGLTNVFLTSQDSTDSFVTRTRAYDDFPDSTRRPTRTVHRLGKTARRCQR